MKKSVILLLLTSSQYIFGYDLTLNNKTSSGLKVAIAYAICNDDEYLIPANTSKTYGTSWCCVSVIKATGTSGPLEGKVKRIETSLCHHNVTFTQDGDKIVINDDKW